MGSTEAFAEHRKPSPSDRATASAGFAFASLAVVAEWVLVPSWPTTSSALALARFALDERDGLLVMALMLASASIAFLVFVIGLVHHLEPCGGVVPSLVTVGAAIGSVTSLGIAAGALALALAGDGRTSWAVVLVATVDGITRLVVIPTMVTLAALAVALFRVRARPEWLAWALVLVVVIDLFAGLPAIVTSDRALHVATGLALEAWVVAASLALWRGRCSVDAVTNHDDGSDA